MNEVKLVSVKENERYIADFACGGPDAGHIWAEPKEDQSSALYLDANFEKAFKIDDISSVFHYELIAENGGLNSSMTGDGKGGIRCSDFDGMLHEDGMTNLPLAVSISHVSEDRFLDVDFAKKVPDLDCKFCDELSVDNLRSEVHSPGTSNEEGVSESSILEPRCFTDQFGKRTTDQIHGASESKCWYDSAVEDKMWFQSSLACDFQEQKSSDVRNTLEIGYSFGQDGKKTHCALNSFKAPCTSVCTRDEVGSVSRSIESEDFCLDDLSTDSCAETKIVRARQRRSCRPPQRYLEGSLWLKSRLNRAKKHPTGLPKDKDLGFRSQKQRRRKASTNRSSKARKSILELDSDEEYEPDASCVDIKKTMKRSDRRKNSKPWTLDEVVVLVNGMSEFGTGQWTSIKRAFFSSSSRTATDIRDKWRNLVKTNCKSSKAREDEQHLRSGSQPLPLTVVERVREIANDAPVLKSKRGERLRDSRWSSMPLKLAE